MGKTDLKEIIKGLKPILNKGEYVFIHLQNIELIPRQISICEFKEKEGYTVVLEKSKADELNLSYSFISSWITLNVNSSLESVGLTAVVSSKLATHQISCNIIAGFHHDHLFVPKNHALEALNSLKFLSENF